MADEGRRWLMSEGLEYAEKRAGMRGFHCMLLESREEVRERLQLQQVQWAAETKPCALIHTAGR